MFLEIIKGFLAIIGIEIFIYQPEFRAFVWKKYIYIYAFKKPSKLSSILFVISDFDLCFLILFFIGGIKEDGIFEWKGVGRGSNDFSFPNI